LSRIIRVESPTTERKRLKRTIAEAAARLQALAPKDDEAKDLAALIVYALRDIEASVESSAVAWEKRNYYVKAERLRVEWQWVGRFAERLGRVVRAGDWARVPAVCAELTPRVADAAGARPRLVPELWNGAYRRLAEE
jgi:hypothetical protein